VKRGLKRKPHPANVVTNANRASWIEDDKCIVVVVDVGCGCPEVSVQIPRRALADYIARTE